MKNSSIAAARQIATELGRSPSHAGTSRLAADLERTSTVTTKHTPGEWRIRSEDRNGHGGIQIEAEGRNGFAVATVYLTHSPDRPENDTDRANAHLIAAAPELLEACKDWEHVFGLIKLNNPEVMKWLNPGVHERTVAAIAKAGAQ
jgi:hypothetical protein